MSNPAEHPGYSVYSDYRVDIHRRRNLVWASLDGVELARTHNPLIVDEQNHGLVLYFPKGDVRLDRLEPVPGHTTRCPWKGIATYWRAPGADQPIAWAYEAPLPEVARIKDHIAFYQDRVTVSLGVAPYLPAWRPSGESGGAGKS
jgi:uncharacterized protein (DUF427 family)